MPDLLAYEDNDVDQILEAKGVRGVRRSGLSEEERIVRALEHDIELGLLLPRERLVEGQLAKRFGAGRYVIRAALRTLENSELLEIRPNRGATVRFVTPQVARELYGVRLVLEDAAFAAIRFPVDTEALGNLEAIQTQHEAAYRSSDLRQVAMLNIEFHNSVYLLSGNAQLVQTIAHVMKRTCGIRSIAFKRTDWRTAIMDEHRKIIDCLSRGSRARLGQTHKRHTNRGLNAYLDVYSTIDSGEPGGNYV